MQRSSWSSLPVLAPRGSFPLTATSTRVTLILLQLSDLTGHTQLCIFHITKKNVKIVLFPSLGKRKSEREEHCMRPSSQAGTCFLES